MFGMWDTQRAVEWSWENLHYVNVCHWHIQLPHSTQYWIFLKQEVGSVLCEFWLVLGPFLLFVSSFYGLVKNFLWRDKKSEPNQHIICPSLICVLYCTNAWFFKWFLLFHSSGYHDCLSIKELNILVQQRVNWCIVFYCTIAFNWSSNAGYLDHKLCFYLFALIYRIKLNIFEMKYLHTSMKFL